MPYFIYCRKVITVKIYKISIFITPRFRTNKRIYRYFVSKFISIRLLTDFISNNLAAEAMKKRLCFPFFPGSPILSPFKMLFQDVSWKMTFMNSFAWIIEVYECWKRKKHFRLFCEIDLYPRKIIWINDYKRPENFFFLSPYCL